MTVLRGVAQGLWRRRMGWALVGLGLAVVAVPVLGLQMGRAVEVPETRVGEAIESPKKSARTEDGRSLVVPEAHRQLGRVYFVLPDRETRVRITSDAPLERIDARGDGVVGYVVVGAPGVDSDRVRPVLAGEFQLAVRSIETGIRLRDEHLREKEWLDEATHPDIVFHFERFERGSVVEAARDTAMGPVTVEGTIVGVLTMRGVSRRMEIDGARLTYLPESAATRRVAEGDLLAIRCRYAVKMEDFGVRQSIIGSTVGESIVLDQVLYLSTVEPGERVVDE